MFKIYIPTRDIYISFPLINKLFPLIISNVPVATINKGPITTTREVILLDALKNNVNPVMIDKDVIPLFDVTEFLGRAKELFQAGYDVACGIYFLKTLAGISVGVFKSRASQYFLPSTPGGEEDDVIWFPAVPVHEIDVDACGLGLAAVNLEFVKKTLDKRPWFEEKLRQIDKDYVWVGEDVTFFKKFKPRTRALPQFQALHVLDGRLVLSPTGSIHVFE